MNGNEEHPRPVFRSLPETVNGRLIISLRDISHTMRSLYEGKGSQKRVLMVLRREGMAPKQVFLQSADGEYSEVKA